MVHYHEEPKIAKWQSELPIKNIYIYIFYCLLKKDSFLDMKTSKPEVPKVKLLINKHFVNGLLYVILRGIHHISTLFFLFHCTLVMRKSIIYCKASSNWLSN